MVSASSPPSLSSPTQLATQSKSGVATLASSSKHLLQATPDSSFSTGCGFSVGSVYKVASNGVRRTRGLAVYASMDQGVMIINPLTQTAVTSFTFSPSLHPITAPLVIQSSTRQYTVMCLAPRNQDSSAEVHIWSQTRGSSSEGLGQEVHHETMQIDSSVRYLHPLTSGEVLAHHDDGSFSLIRIVENEPIQIQAQSTASHLTRKWTHHISVLDRFASATIMRSASRKPGLALVVRFSSVALMDSPAKGTRKGRRSAIDVIDEAEGQSSSTALPMSASGGINLEIFSVEEGEGGDRISLLSSASVLRLLHLKDARDVQDITMHHSGRLALCTVNGHITASTLKLNADLTPSLTPATLISLPSIAHSNPSSVRIASLQLVSSSTALVVIGEPIHDKISALLVDLELDCVLSESTWNAKGVEATFVHRAAGSIALVIATRQDTSSKVGSTLWTLPYEISEESHLRWALSSSALTRKWIGSEKSKERSDEAEASRKQLLKELERVVANKKGESVGKSIDEAFEKWYKKESTRLEAHWLANANSQAAMMNDEGSSDSEVEKSHSKKKGKDGKHKLTGGKIPTPSFPQTFVFQIVTFALPSASEEGDLNAAYAMQTVHRLLKSRVISSSSRPNILSSLKATNDWEAVFMALRCVNDLPEHDIIDILLQLVHQRKNGTVDTKRLKIFISVFASLALNRSQLRAALKSSLNEVDDVIAVFEILCTWLDRTQETLLDDFTLPGATTTGQKKRKSGKSKLPEIDEILSLLCDLMDTFFPLFLSTESTHQHLNRLSKQINGHLTIYNQLLILRGPLAAFSRLEADREREAAMESAKSLAKDAEEQMMSLRKANKKAVHGKYNVIGEVGGGLGKGVLGDKSRRRQLYEENISVGLYTLERLEL